MDQQTAKPKISFVIPAYNEAKNLPGCLESIQKEIGRLNASAEVIVVNNASTDETKKIAQSFPGIIVVDETRKGITFARHAGFLASSGELVANIDADNLLPAGWLEKVMREFAKHPRLVCLSGPLFYFDLPSHQRAVVRVYSYITFVAYLINHFVLKIGSVVQGGNFIISRKALEQIGGFNTAIKFYGEDTDIARRLSRVGWVKYSLSLPTNSSGRRLAKEGVVATGYKYLINYYSVLLRHKPATHDYQDIRD